MNSTRLTVEAFLVFQEATNLTFSQWSALQFALHNEHGGRHPRPNAEILISNVLSFFNSEEPLYSADLEDILENFLDSLDTDADDGSIEEVADKLFNMYEECLEGNYQSLENLRASKGTHATQVNDENDEDEDDHNAINMMVVDVPNLEANSNQVDVSMDASSSRQGAEVDDGWQVVSHRRNLGGRTVNAAKDS